MNAVLNKNLSLTVKSVYFKCFVVKIIDYQQKFDFFENIAKNLKLMLQFGPRYFILSK